MITASIDLKCPTEKFFEQKMMMINNAKPEFQNVPKEYFYQAQMQMMSLSKYNESVFQFFPNFVFIKFFKSWNSHVVT